MNILIIGAGVVGTTLARHLSGQQHNVTLIAADRDMVRALQETMDVQVFHGNASDQALLREAGLLTADLVFAVTDSDETNIVLTLMAHGENPNAFIMVRILGEEYANHAALWHGDRFHNTHIFNPDQAATESLVQLLKVPNAWEVIPVADREIRLAGFRLGQHSPLLGRPLRETMQAGMEKVLIVAAEQQGEVHLPSGDTHLQAGDLVYVTWTPATRFNNLLHLLGVTPAPVRRVVIVGGGRIGTGLAETLLREEQAEVALIEHRLERCHTLADHLPDARILHGDATDLAYLREVCHPSSTLVAVSGRQETNFMLALLGRRLGLPRVVAMLDNEAYMALAADHGIDAVVSPKLSTVGAILGTLRKGQILDSAPMLNGRLHAFMVAIEPASPLADRPLAEMKMPRGILVAALLRQGEIVVPTGSSQLLAGDHALILCATPQVQHLDELLAPAAGTHP